MFGLIRAKGTCPPSSSCGFLNSPQRATNLSELSVAVRLVVVANFSVALRNVQLRAIALFV